MLWTALLLGLAGSLHCVAMCGPLAMSIPAGGATGGHLLFRRLVYNLGRVLTYAFIGAIFGLLGQFIALVAYQQVLSIVAGSILLLWVLFRYVKIPFLSGAPMRLWAVTGKPAYMRLVRRHGMMAVAALGTLNGFLPCGLVYVAASASLGMSGIGGSMAYMALFGLGTLPSMLGISFLPSILNIRWRSLLSRTVPYLALVMAFLFILRGLSLDIPYLSPKIMQSANGEIHSCCKKPQ